MIKSSNTDNSEINLAEIILVIWRGKWKLVLATVVSIAFMHYYNVATKTKNFTATTDILPITTAEESKYIALIESSYTSLYDLNNFKSKPAEVSNFVLSDENTETSYNSRKFTISKKHFLSLYIEILNEKVLFEEAIRKFNLLDSNQYKDNKEYNDAVIKFASSIKIKTPFNGSQKSKNNLEKKNGYEINFATIQLEYDDIEKWKSVLSYVDKSANKAVRENLRNHYQRLLKITKQERIYLLEDLSLKIDNLIRDYERKTTDYVLYLKEQAAIARKLGIAKNTIEVQTFGNQNSLLSSIIAEDSPFYFRGYDAIEEEILLITSRKNKKAFIDNLFKLEQKKRNIMQDKTVSRAEEIFKTTPLANNKDFYAATAKVSATKIKSINNNISLLLALVIGLIIGVIYVIISNAIQSFKVIKEK